MQNFNRFHLPENDAVRIVLTYLLLGTLWIFFSDRLLAAVVHDQTLLTSIQSYKGVLFVLITSAFLYLLVDRTTDKFRSINNQIDLLLKKEKAARRKTERTREKLEKVLYEAPSPICILEGSQHTYTFVNRAYKKLFGKRSLTGKKVAEAMPEIAATEYLEILNTVYETGEGYSGTERSLTIEKEGKPHTYFRDLVYQPLSDEERGTYGIFVQLNDITGMVNTRRELEDLLNEKEILLSELHHRVKNNLAVIVGLVDLQSFEVDSPVAETQLKNTQSRVHTIADIHHLLYRDGSLKEVNLHDLIQNLTGKCFASPEIPAPSLRLQIDDLMMNVNQAVSLGLFLNEIFTLASNHIPSGDKKQVELETDLSTFPRLAVTVKLSPTEASLHEKLKAENGSLESTLVNLLSKQLNADLTTSHRNGTTVVDLAFTLADKKGSSSNLAG